MQKRISTIPFTDTPEQHQKLLDLIESLKGRQGAVMPALQGAQEIYGYLPMEVQKEIARGLDVSLEEVYGVSTFYSQFSLTPKGKYNISVCLGTACYVKGADKVLDRLVTKLGIQPEECTEDRLRPRPGPHGQRGRLRPPCAGVRRQDPRQVHGVRPCGSFR